MLFTAFEAFAAAAVAPLSALLSLGFLRFGAPPPLLGRAWRGPPFVFHSAGVSRPRRARLGSITVASLPQAVTTVIDCTVRGGVSSNASGARWVSLAYARRPHHVFCRGGLRCRLASGQPATAAVPACWPGNAVGELRPAGRAAVGAAPRGSPLCWCPLAVGTYATFLVCSPWFLFKTLVGAPIPTNVWGVYAVGF